MLPPILIPGPSSNHAAMFSPKCVLMSQTPQVFARNSSSDLAFLDVGMFKERERRAPCLGNLSDWAELPLVHTNAALSEDARCEVGFCHWIVHRCFPECSSTQGQQRVSHALSISQVSFKGTQLLIFEHFDMVGQWQVYPLSLFLNCQSFLTEIRAQHMSSVLTYAFLWEPSSRSMLGRLQWFLRTNMSAYALHIIVHKHWTRPCARWLTKVPKLL